MATIDVERLRRIKTLPSLVKFLRDELDWPVDAEDVDDLTFDFTPEELGLDSRHAAKIKEIKQLRPLDSKQPWGIFWVSFEKRRLPMVVLRRILGSLVIKTRAGARKADRPGWHLNDLLFISSYGEEEHRSLSFAHFSEDPAADELPVLRVLGWDDQNSILHLDRVAGRLQSHFRWPHDPADIEGWRQGWSEAFTDRYGEAISSAKELIPRLAQLAITIRRRVRDVLDAETERGPMRRLFAAVRELLIHNMDEDGFADMYAQTVAYGLLSASFSRPAGLTAQNLVQLTAVSNPFLENLLENLFRLKRGKFHFDVDEVGINDVLDLLRNTNIEAIKAAFSDQNPAEDPVIRFYEGFLKQYDPEQRVRRGVFFTPRPVVSYIVRSVHELLQTEFGLEDGLASTATWGDMRRRFPELSIPEGTDPGAPFVCVLDPAVGTGTFLFECVEVIERTMKDGWCQELGKKNWSDPEIVRRWREYVPKHLLPRLFSYELMMAPYAIAHLKLALKLGETSYQFHEGDRVHVYLTNSLEPPSDVQPALTGMFPALAHEAEAVNEIKRKQRFTVVIGNPPYAAISSNLTPELRRIVDPYRFVGGERIRERSMLQFEKNIQDDYVKFFAFSQARLEEAGGGICSLITNHSYLDGPTLRGMRWNLVSRSQVGWFLDLHGNANKAEIAPDGVRDENVFDIRQGVAICALVKHPGRRPPPRVHVGEMWGERSEKYERLSALALPKMQWRPIEVSSPYYYLVKPDEEEFAAEWARWPAVCELFTKRSTGTETGFDHLLLNFTTAELKERVALFGDPSASRQSLSDVFDFSDGHAAALFERRKELRVVREGEVQPLQLRAYDYRWALLRKDLLKTNSFNVMLDLGDGAPGLVTTRQTKEDFSAFAVKGFCGHKLTSSYDRSYVFPLFTRGEGEFLSSGYACLDQALLGRFQSMVARDNPERKSERELALDVFKYALAVLNAPSYTKRFGQRLKRDWPKVPLPGSLALFHALARLGGELAALHLVEAPAQQAVSARYDKAARAWRYEVEKGHDVPVTLSFNGLEKPVVGKVGWSDDTTWIDAVKAKNNAADAKVTGTIGFRGVPEAVWNFHVGGYQVCEKWLKDRKDRTLTAADIAHYHRIVIALHETIRLMAEIDKVVDAHGGWPGAFAPDVTPRK